MRQPTAIFLEWKKLQLSHWKIFIGCWVKNSPIPVTWSTSYFAVTYPEDRLACKSFLCVQRNSEQPPVLFSRVTLWCLQLQAPQLFSNRSQTSPSFSPTDNRKRNETEKHKKGHPEQHYTRGSTYHHHGIWKIHTSSLLALQRRKPLSVSRTSCQTWHFFFQLWTTKSPKVCLWIRPPIP